MNSEVRLRTVRKRWLELIQFRAEVGDTRPVLHPLQLRGTHGERVGALLEIAIGRVVDALWANSVPDQNAALTRENVVEGLREEVRQAMDALSNVTLVGSTLPARIAWLVKHVTETRERFDELNRVLPGHRDDACPTWHDGCWCTVETLIHNVNRAQVAEAEVKRLRALICHGCDDPDYMPANEQGYHRQKLTPDVPGNGLFCKVDHP